MVINKNYVFIFGMKICGMLLLVQNSMILLDLCLCVVLIGKFVYIGYFIKFILIFYNNII